MTHPKDEQRWEDVEEATELVQEERFVEALVELRKVLAADPENAYAYHYLGVAFFELENLEASRDAYRAAVRLAPDYLGARVSLSHALRELGEVDEAIRQAREALRRFPKDGEAQHALGMAHAAKGNRAEARRHLQGFLESGPEFEAATEVRAILDSLGLGDRKDED